MQRKSRKNSSLLILGILVFAGLIFILFSTYQSWLNVKFEQQVMENYTAYIESEGVQFSGTVDDIQGTLQTLAALLSQSQPEPENAALNPALSLLSGLNEHFEVQWRSPEEIQLSSAQREQLMQNKTIITGIETQNSEQSVFCVLTPVIRDLQLEAILQASVDVNRLLQKSQSERIQAPLNSWIVLLDGSVLYTANSNESHYSNLYALLEENSNSETTLQQIRTTLQTGSSGTFRIQTHKEGALYVSLTPLAVNGWTLVNFTHANEASENSRQILLTTMQIGLFLILTTAGLAYLFYLILARQRRQMNLEQRRYAFLSRFSDTLIFEYDVIQDTLELTGNAQKILPVKELSASHVKKNHELTPFIHAEDFYKIEEAFNNVHRFQEYGSVQLRIKTRDGSYHWFNCQFQAVYERYHREPVMIIGKLTDIQEQKYIERELIEKSSYDGLTSVLNKRAAEQQITEELSENAEGCLFMIGIDDFKVINDELGHFVGDQVLTVVGTLLKTYFRQNDLIGRIGGDEFIVFLHTSDPAVIHQKVKQLTKTLPKLLQREQIDAEVTLSIGAALSQSGDTYPSLFSRADQAMYCAKQQGKNQFHLAEIHSDSWDRKNNE